MLLEELQMHLLEITKIQVSTVTIWRMLQWLGYTMKTVGLILWNLLTYWHNSQIMCPAMEKNEEEHIEYKMDIGKHYQPSQLVFVDESSFNCMTMWHPIAWCQWGDCARHWEVFVQGTRCICNIFLTTQLIFGRYLILPALSLDSILHVEVLNHTIDGANFLSFIEG